MTEPVHVPRFATTSRLTGFEQVSAVFADWQGQIEQVSSGLYKGTLQIVSGGLIRISEMVSNQKLRGRGHDSSGLISIFPVNPSCAADIWQGRRLNPGELIVQGIHAEVDHTTCRECGIRALALHPDALDDAARALLCTDRTVVPKTWTIHSPPPDAFTVFNTRLLHLLAQGTADPSLLATPEGRLCEQECVAALVAALASGTVSQPKLPFPARSRILVRAEEFMRSRLGDPVGAIDLCRELGVSDRTLRLSFQERYGVGPMTYLRFLRLNAVRSRLRADQEVAIADAARELGFHHLGNFAADYRSLFGMRPSDTRLSCDNSEL